MADAGSGAPGRGAEDETRVDLPASATPPPATGGAWASPPAPPSQPPPPGPAPVPAPGGYPSAYGGSAGSSWGAPPATSAFAVPGTSGLEFAGGWPRFVAYLIDGILLSIINGLLTGVIVAVAPGSPQPPYIATLIAVAIDAAYFIGLWTSGGKATVGMRLLHLQVGNAFDGRTLDVAQAARRWIALGSWLSALTVTATLATLTVSLSLLWALILLISVVTSSTKQGLHDRFANSAVVRPIGAGGGLIAACAVIVLVLALVVLFSIVALIFLGGQMSTILSQVGTSV